MGSITEKQAVRKIAKAVLDASSDPNDLPTSDTNEGAFLIDVYQLMEFYNISVD